ncbi:unnamed protein product [Pylaiella littoralis]
MFGSKGAFSMDVVAVAVHSALSWRSAGVTPRPMAYITCLPADAHIDATSVPFVEHFMEGGRRRDWVVSSPPYKNALLILKNACQIAKVGVAFKLRLNFLEPVPSRAQWLMDNLPSTVKVLSRATYRGRKSSGVEAWLFWKVNLDTAGDSMFFAPKRRNEEARKP